LNIHSGIEPVINAEPLHALDSELRSSFCSFLHEQMESGIEPFKQLLLAENVVKFLARLKKL
jgi:hypothetical protein